MHFCLFINPVVISCYMNGTSNSKIVEKSLCNNPLKQFHEIYNCLTPFRLSSPIAYLSSHIKNSCHWFKDKLIVICLCIVTELTFLI